MRAHALRFIAILVLIAPAVRGGESAWTLLDQGLKLYHKKQYDKARHCFEAALRKDARCQDACYYLGTILEKQGKVEEAVALYKRIQPKYPTYSLAAERLGHIALRRGDLETAEKCFATHAKARPGVRAWLQLAEVQLDRQRYKEAEASLKEATKLSPDDLDAAEMKGRLYMETERYKLAVPEYTKILKFIPKDSNARFLRGLCYQELGRPADALRDFEGVVKIDPWHRGALQALVEAYAGDPTRKEQSAEYRRRLEILEKSPPRVRPVSGGK